MNIAHPDQVEDPIPKLEEGDKIKMKKRKFRKPKKIVQEKEHYPVQLAYQNLTFSVPVNEKKKGLGALFKKKQVSYKTILNNLTGTFEPGTLTAIMGSSGAGKTTLLNVLAGRCVGKIDGEILFNGHPKKEAGNIIKKQAYVMQDDIMLGSSTGRELLQFAANLRMGEEFTQQQRVERVDALIKELGLQNCENTRVGTPGESRGVSGGERKRIAIGMELVTNPSLLFLDEPTSGLDSYTAEKVIETLRKLAKSGRTVICTIHQPNSNIFRLFDNLILLAKGETIYNGKTDEALHYFEELGYKCPEDVNPADFFMKLIHIEQSSQEGDSKVKKLIQDYKDSNLCRQNFQVETPKLKIDEEKLPKYTRKTNTQIKYLLKRNYLDILREPLKIRSTLSQSILISVVLGLVFLRLDNDQNALQSKLGALFFIMINSGMSSISAVINTFPKEKKVFIREYASRMYSTSAFFLSKIIAEFPFQVVSSILFGTITYWMIGYQSAFDKYLIFIADIILLALTGGGIGLLLGTLAKDASVATALVPVAILPFVIFSGYFINSETVPDYFIWVEYISFLKYGFRAVAVNELRGLQLTCAEDEKIQGKCPIPNGDAQIDILGFDGATPGVDLCIVLGFYVGFVSLAYLALLWRARTSKANA
eukprot:TRINITY_DN5780_c0_g1_i1.p1 TRINITY_DN5780_c0_g1~~TRINITY_DN5780_c0_g1_i1.p1  ORF type:complete len:650 (-),score=148.57 TRINITY_DN5780_c0_g1_i1:3-1952(-)